MRHDARCRAVRRAGGSDRHVAAGWWGQPPRAGPAHRAYL